MDDSVEHYIRAYASRRQGSHTPMAQALVDAAVRKYNNTLKVLRRHTANSRQFWGALQELSSALDAILLGLPGDPDYYFGPRQFEELVLPALQAVPPPTRQPLFQGALVLVGDLVGHTRCDALPLKAQRAGLEALTGALRALRGAKALQGKAEARFCAATAACYLLFWTAREDAPPRDFSMDLAAEAGRGGWLKEALLILARPSMIPGDFGQMEADEGELHIEYMAACIADGLVKSGDLATAERMATWAAGKLEVVRMMVQRLRRPLVEGGIHLMNLLRVVSYLGCVSPQLLAALKAAGLRPTLDQLRVSLRRCPSEAVQVEGMIRDLLKMAVAEEEEEEEEEGVGGDAQPAQQRRREQGPAGQGSGDGAKQCAGCGVARGGGVKLRLCAGCHEVYFCGVACQRRAWPEHRAACRAAAGQKQQ